MNNYQQQNYGYGTQMRQPQMPVMSPNFLKGRPVASLEEVKAASIDFDGSVFFFPDLANKRIYTKQINLDGSASYGLFEAKPIIQQEQVSTGNFVSREEFEAALAKIREALATFTATKNNSVEVATETPVESKPKTIDFNFH